MCFLVILTDFMGNALSKADIYSSIRDVYAISGVSNWNMGSKSICDRMFLNLFWLISFKHLINFIFWEV